jgi:hypothetical protein
MLSPFGNGHHLGATPGTWEEPGDRSLSRVPGTGGGARRQQGQATGRPGAARPGKAPHLIHGGPCLILPGGNVLCQDRHAGNPPECQPR